MPSYKSCRARWCHRRCFPSACKPRHSDTQARIRCNCQCLAWAKWKSMSGPSCKTRVTILRRKDLAKSHETVLNWNALRLCSPTFDRLPLVARRRTAGPRRKAASNRCLATTTKKISNRCQCVVSSFAAMSSVAHSTSLFPIGALRSTNLPD